MEMLSVHPLDRLEHLGMILQERKHILYALGNFLQRDLWEEMELSGNEDTG